MCNSNASNGEQLPWERKRTEDMYENTSFSSLTCIIIRREPEREKMSTCWVQQSLWHVKVHTKSNNCQDDDDGDATSAERGWLTRSDQTFRSANLRHGNDQIRIKHTGDTDSSLIQEVLLWQFMRIHRNTTNSTESHVTLTFPSA